MNDQLMGAAPRKHFNPLWCVLRKPVARMPLKVVDGKYPRAAGEEREGEVKPGMGALVVHHVRSEFVDLSNQRSNAPKLLERLTEPRIGERIQAHAIIELRAMRCDSFLGKNEQHFGALRQAVG